MNLLETSVACWVVVVDEVPPVVGKLVLLHCWVQLVRCWLEQDWKRKEVLKGSVMITIKSFEMDQQNKKKLTRRYIIVHTNLDKMNPKNSEFCNIVNIIQLPL